MNRQDFAFPKKLASNRLILRPIKKGDEFDLMEIYSDMESSLLDDWMPWTNIEQALIFVNNAAKDFSKKETLRLGIIEKNKKKLIGCCGLFEFDYGNKKCMIFYQINSTYWNNGYATEAVKRIVKFAFEKIKVNRIEAFITPGNIASEIVLLKNGFIKEGIMREMEFYKDKFWDGAVMAIIKNDYDKLKINS